MAEKVRLSADDVQQKLSQSDWEGNTDAIKKSFEFKDFLTAIDFINKMAPHAEELDHHPELFNVYNRVDITLTTHDADGVTALDFALAERLDEIVRSM